MSILPTTPAEAAQLIADALNAATRAGFSPHWDQDEGGMSCWRRVDGKFEHADIHEDHEGVWRLTTQP